MDNGKLYQNWLIAYPCLAWMCIHQQNRCAPVSMCLFWTWDKINIMLVCVDSKTLILTYTCAYCLNVIDRVWSKIIIQCVKTFFKTKTDKPLTAIGISFKDNSRELFEFDQFLFHTSSKENNLRHILRTSSALVKSRRVQ